MTRSHEDLKAAEGRRWGGAWSEALFAVGLLLVYTAFSPLTVSEMGYSREGPEFVAHLLAQRGIEPSWPAPQSVPPRHGFLQPVMAAPFVLAGLVLFPQSPGGAEAVVALEPVVTTVLLLALLLRWMKRMDVAPRRALAYALAAAFATMLWPYAYMGMETTQALFLLLAGYLAFTGEPGPARTLALAIAAGCAVAAKAQGVLLVPAVASLGAAYVWRLRRGRPLRSVAAWSGFLAVVVLGVFVLGVWTRSWSPSYYGPNLFIPYVVETDLVVAISALSLLLSANKGLIVYAPLALLGLARLPAAWRKNRALAVWAGLTVAGLVAGFSLIYQWADDTWGPRYLHAAVAPLILCAALGAPLERSVAARSSFAACLLAGLVVSGLGISFYYGHLHQVATRANRNTTEALQHDPSWNHVRFNARLLALACDAPIADDDARRWWPPAPHWWFQRPPGAPPEARVDLRPFLTPQPILVRAAQARRDPSWRAALNASTAALALGVTILIAVAAVAWRPARP